MGVRDEAALGSQESASDEGREEDPLSSLAGKQRHRKAIPRKAQEAMSKKQRGRPKRGTPADKRFKRNRRKKG
ncbi:hypothetical protein PP993_gp04 [Gordonia phage Mayweather]|uniref:Uncharacterized protein n=1 Tax=Gordonia phage Mayweather TaxID=2590931 RepID=A0A516KU09_9CAUD|nr:hypothetical protein PP993_gp04 [Gordonia phage Mayweather]QDP45166.1 hypothetical protein SEA_MAYWEATHER_4 [Gordonia phage Mayweather]